MIKGKPPKGSYSGKKEYRRESISELFDELIPIKKIAENMHAE